MVNPHDIASGNDLRYVPNGSSISCGPTANGRHCRGICRRWQKSFKFGALSKRWIAERYFRWIDHDHHLARPFERHATKSHKCKLARYVRKYLHEMDIHTGVTVVFSPEDIDPEKVIVTEKAFPKKSIIGTISYMPAIFGCTTASVVIRALYNKE